MTIHLYTLCWNEADILGFFFRHYDAWVDRYVVFDDGSTDGSLDILAAHPRVEIRRFERKTKTSFVASQQHLQNEIWKESRGRADWVIITALDEHLHVKSGSLTEYLRACRAQGVTLMPALGYQMLSEDFPKPDEHLCRTRTLGAPARMMNKLSLFDPNALTATGFDEGRHQARPAGQLRYPARDELMLLHYKYIGFERLVRRHHAQSGGLGERDRAEGWGQHYLWSENQLRADWDAYLARAVDIAAPDFVPSEHFEGPRWWHPEEMPPPRRKRRWWEKLWLRRG